MASSRRRREKGTKRPEEARKAALFGLGPIIKKLVNLDLGRRRRQRQQQQRTLPKNCRCSPPPTRHEGLRRLGHPHRLPGEPRVDQEPDQGGVRRRRPDRRGGRQRRRADFRRDLRAPLGRLPPRLLRGGQPRAVPAQGDEGRGDDERGSCRARGTGIVGLAARRRRRRRSLLLRLRQLGPAVVPPAPAAQVPRLCGEARRHQRGPGGPRGEDDADASRRGRGRLLLFLGAAGG